MHPLRGILIAGPTASGKSAWAIRLAERHNGVIVNADSMQVYRDLSLLTARPGRADLAAAPHTLYGYVAGAEPYSVGRWITDAEAAIHEAWQQGRLPIVVGGTGLYFKALLEGLSPIPPIPTIIREHWRSEATRLGPAALHALLSARDPLTAAGLQATDPQRLTRALEVLEATGRPLSDWQREPGRPVLRDAEVMRCVVTPPNREMLQARADARFDAMMAAGALDEVRDLLAIGYSRELPVMRALGVAPLAAHLRGEMQLEGAVARAKLDTRQYVKRQLTWLKRNMMSWECISTQFMKRNTIENFTFTQN